MRSGAVGYLQRADVSVARYHLLIGVLDRRHIGVAECACGRTNSARVGRNRDERAGQFFLPLLLSFVCFFFFFSFSVVVVFFFLVAGEGER